VTAPRVERRRSRRQRTIREHGIESARVRRGVHVEIIDVSTGGVLVETRQRLLPGMPLDVHFERDKRISTIRGRVLRCVVVRLTASAVCYRGAIGFDGHQPWLVPEAGAGSSFTTAEGQ
jgi:PilZ domain